MERFDKYKLDDLKTWKKLSWLTTICYGFYCLSLIFNTLLEDVSENVDAMNESNLPLYILFFVIANKIYFQYGRTAQYHEFSRKISRGRRSYSE